METPEITRERIGQLKKALPIIFALLAGMLIETWRADGRSRPEVVKAEVTVGEADGLKIFEFRPATLEGEEAYIRVSGDGDYPKGSLTALYRPRIRLEPRLVEPDLTLRPTKAPAKVKVAVGRPRRVNPNRGSHRGEIPPLPSLDLK